MNKAPDAFRTISEVADELDLPQHVLRFWESRFPNIRPMKRGGGRRYYRPEDIDLLRGIRHLLYGDGYTIRGVQRILREQGVRTVQAVGQGANLLVPLRDDGDDAEDEPNGNPTAHSFISPLGASASDKMGDLIEERDLDDLALSEFVPQNRPMAEANSDAVASAPRVEAVRLRQASLSVTAPLSKRMAVEDLGRLKQALAELEACRRLLHKANEGGR